MGFPSPVLVIKTSSFISLTSSAAKNWGNISCEGLFIKQRYCLLWGVIISGGEAVDQKSLFYVGRGGTGLEKTEESEFYFYKPCVVFYGVKGLFKA